MTALGMGLDIHMGATTIAYHATSLRYEYYQTSNVVGVAILTAKMSQK